VTLTVLLMLRVDTSHSFCAFEFPKKHETLVRIAVVYKVFAPA